MKIEAMMILLIFAVVILILAGCDAKTFNITAQEPINIECRFLSPELIKEIKND